MKKILFVLIAFFSLTAVFAQVPSRMNYQAVARNASGQALANQTIKVRLTLQMGTALPIPFYSETRTVATNALGLFNVQVGAAGAQNVVGSMSSVNWLENSQPRSMKVEIDAANNGSFVDMGSQQLVSVPYALAAKEAESAGKISKPQTAFHAIRTNSQTIPYGSNGSFTTLLFNAETVGGVNIDSSNIYNPATGMFTVPEDGYYYIEYKIRIQANNAISGDWASFGFHSSLRGGLLNSDVNGHRVNMLAGVQGTHNSMVTYLKKDDMISVRIMQISRNTTADWYLIGDECYFQAYRIR